MTWKQYLGFFLCFLVFCVCASIIIYPIGAFDYGPEALWVLAVAYVICGALLYRYLESIRQLSENGSIDHRKL